MATLSKEQVTKIIQNRPEGTTPQDIVKGLLSKGHKLEGLQTAQPEPAKEKGLIDTAKDVINKRADQMGEVVDSNQSLASKILQVAGAGVGASGDLIFEALKKGASALGIKEPIKQGVKAVTDTKPAQDIAKTVSDWTAKHPEAAKNLTAVLEIASVLPSAKIADVGVNATAKGAKIAAEATADVAKEGVKGTGRVLEATGKTIQGSTPIFKPTTQEAGRIITQEAKTNLVEKVGNVLKGNAQEGIRKIADTATDWGLAGLTEKQIGVQAKRLKTQLWDNTIEPALTSIKKTIAKDDIFKSVETKILKLNDESAKNAYLEALDAVKEDYAKVKEFTYPQLQNLKSELAGKVPVKAYNGKDISGAVGNIRKMLSDTMREEIYKEVPDKVKKAYLDYGNLGTIVERGANALTKPYMEGGSGKILGAIIRDTTTPLKSIGGKIIKKIGEKLK